MNDLIQTKQSLAELTDDEVIQASARLNELDYQRYRKDIAERLGVGVTGLDKIIRDYRNPSRMGRAFNTVGRAVLWTTISWITRRAMNAMFGRGRY